MRVQPRLFWETLGSFSRHSLGCTRIWFEGKISDICMQDAGAN
jgi:hypothetical protein